MANFFRAAASVIFRNFNDDAFLDHIWISYPRLESHFPTCLNKEVVLLIWDYLMDYQSHFPLVQEIQVVWRYLELVFYVRHQGHTWYCFSLDLLPVQRPEKMTIFIAPYISQHINLNTLK